MQVLPSLLLEAELILAAGDLSPGGALPMMVGAPTSRLKDPPNKEIFRLSSSPSISAAAAPDISHSFVTWSKEMTDAAASKLQPTSSLPVKLSTAPHPVMHDGSL